MAGWDSLMLVYNELMQLKISENFPYVEPSELEAIRRERSSGPRKLTYNLNQQFI